MMLISINPECSAGTVETHSCKSPMRMNCSSAIVYIYRKGRSTWAEGRMRRHQAVRTTTQTERAQVNHISRKSIYQDGPEPPPPLLLFVRTIVVRTFLLRDAKCVCAYLAAVNRIHPPSLVHLYKSRYTHTGGEAQGGRWKKLHITHTRSKPKASYKIFRASKEITNGIDKYLVLKKMHMLQREVYM